MWHPFNFLPVSLNSSYFIMSKNLLHIIVWLYALVGASAQAIVVEGFIFQANGKPLTNAAVFLYNNQGKLQKPNSHFLQYQYTSDSGKYRFSLSSLQAGDSIGVGFIDCHNNFNYNVKQLMFLASNQTLTMPKMKASCRPVACQNFLKRTLINKGRHLKLEAIKLLNDPKNQLKEKSQWSFSDGTNMKGRRVTKNVFNAPFTLLKYCFSTATICNNIQCDSVNIFANPNLKNCHAQWEVDTVNSLRFEGKVVVWNHSMGQGHSTLFKWNFGDGHISKERFPTHHYKDTGIYNLCVSVISITGADTCFSKYCNRIGIDSTGKLIHKKESNGFTLHVANPGTVGISEYEKMPVVEIFPNPAQEYINVNWNRDNKITSIELFNIQGQKIRERHIPERYTQNKTTLDTKGIEVGTYFIKAKTPMGITTHRVLIKD